MTARFHETTDAEFEVQVRNLVRVVSACTLGLWSFSAGLLMGAFFCFEQCCRGRQHNNFAGALMSDNPNHLLWRERTYERGNARSGAYPEAVQSVLSLSSSPKADIHPYNSDVYLGRH